MCHYLTTKLFYVVYWCSVYRANIRKQKFYALLTIRYRLKDDTVYPNTYQITLTVVGFTAAHSGIYTVTINNREGTIMEQFERRVEG